MHCPNQEIHARPRHRLNAIVTACVLAWAVPTLPALAQQTGAALNAERVYNLPAQPLGQALNDLARQAGVAITVDAGLVAGRTSPVVSGSLTVRQALERLLAGSGLVAEAERGVVAVKRAASAATSETTLSAVRVTASAEIRAQNSVHLDSADIARINPADLDDLFKGQAGIQVGSELPVSQKLYVQGVEETNLAVTIDGSRQNNKIFHHNATTLIDPTLLKAVRVDPGVAPADAGPGALAGAVAYETLDASELLLPGRKFGGLIKSEIESNGGIFANSGALFGAGGGFEYLAFVKKATGDPRKDGDGEKIIGSGTDLVSGLGKIAWQAASGDRFELSHESVRDDEARPYRADMGRVIGGRPVPLTRNYDLHRRNTAFTYTDRTPSGWWDPRIQLARSVTDLNIDEPSQLLRGITESTNGKLENRFALRHGSVTAGFDFYSDEASTDFRFPANPAWNEASAEKVRNRGVYGQARMEVNERARVSFGGRFDKQRFTGVDGSRFSDSGFSYNLSGELDVTAGLTASAGHSDVWAGVPLAENFIINPTWSYPGRMKAVTSDNTFIGFRSDLGGAVRGLVIDGKLFRTNIQNARTPEWGPGPDLRKDMDSRGYEIGAAYAWRESSVRLRYADIDTRIDGNPSESYTGRYLTTPIGRVVTFEAKHGLDESQWALGLNARFVLEERNTYISDTGSRGLPLPSYEVVDLFAEYKPIWSRELTVRAEINNLFDKAYASRATYGQEYGTGSVIPLNEPGRAFKLMASYRF